MTIAAFQNQDASNILGRGGGRGEDLIQSHEEILACCGSNPATRPISEKTPGHSTSDGTIDLSPGPLGGHPMGRIEGWGVPKPGATDWGPAGSLFASREQGLRKFKEGFGLPRA